MSRELSEKYLYKTLDAITGNKDNSTMWRKRLSKLSNAAYRKFIQRCADGNDKIYVVMPNHGKSKINVNKCMELSTDIGFKYFERLVIPERDGVPKHTTAVEYLVVTTQIKRPSQVLDKKLSVTHDDSATDLMTQQARGDSDSAALSYPELQLLAQTGLTATATEYMSARGGDNGTYRAMVAQLEATGKTDLETIGRYSTDVQSRATLRAYLVAIHIGTNL